MRSSPLIIREICAWQGDFMKHTAVEEEEGLIGKLFETITDYML